MKEREEQYDIVPNPNKRVAAQKKSTKKKMSLDSDEESIE